MSSGYNGWRSYETWLIGVNWRGNLQGTDARHLASGVREAPD